MEWAIYSGNESVLSGEVGFESMPQTPCLKLYKLRSLFSSLPQLTIKEDFPIKLTGSELFRNVRKTLLQD